MRLHLCSSRGGDKLSEMVPSTACLQDSDTSTKFRAKKDMKLGGSGVLFSVKRIPSNNT